jgi:chromosome segregation ATPase
MTENIHELNEKSCADDKVMKEIIEALDSVVTYFPRIRNDYGNIMQQDVVKVLLLIATGIKAMHYVKDKDAREISHLQKTTALKDKKLREAETDLIKAREFKGAREEKLSQENRKLEFELSNVRHELEKARKEPDYVREQFSNKIQKLHDKIRGLQNDAEQQSRAKNILELDNEAMTKDLDSKCTKIERQKEQLKKFREEFIKVKEERDQLRSKQPFNEPDAHAHVKKLESNIRELEEDIRSLKQAKATSDETIHELEEDLRNLNSAKATGEETIRELLQQQAEQKKEISNLQASLVTMEEIQNTTMDEPEKEREKGSINFNRDKNGIISTSEKKRTKGSTNVNIDQKATILELEKELADERSKLKLAEGREVEFAALLAAERAKSKRPEDKLGPLLVAAVAAGSL